MIVTIGGMPGSGKSTLAKVLSEKLKLKRYYMGLIFREKAKEKGMDILAYNEYLTKHPEEEKEIDKLIIDLGKKESNFLIESRVAHHLIPHAIKILVKIDLKVAGKRIYNDLLSKKTNRDEKIYKTEKEAYEATKKRYQSELKRYKKLYGINISDESQYDIVLDTTNLTIQESIKKLSQLIKQKRAKFL